MSAKLSADSLLNLVKNRRSYYPLTKNLTISTERVEEIVKEALQHVPSSFNSQSNRVVVLTGAAHEKLWDITLEVLKTIISDEQVESTSGKINMFKAAAGSVLFFTDEDVVKGMQNQFPIYSEQFPLWATQSNAMLQFVAWTALEAEGLGCNLQHYNPLIDEKVASTWNVPSNWKLSSQLVFGGKTGDAGDKAFKPVEEKYKSFSS